MSNTRQIKYPMTWLTLICMSTLTLLSVAVYNYLQHGGI